MYRKLLSLFLAALICLSAFAFAEEAADRVSPEALSMYDSVWYSPEARADITPQDGEMKVQILMPLEDDRGYCWEYSTVFNAETKKLEAVRPAVKFSVFYPDEGGFELTDTLYEETVEASFELDGNGRLLWHDGKEDAGKDISFEKIGRFDGTIWVCGRATVSVYWEEEGYKVGVEWGSSAWEYTEWEYSCFYDPESNTLISMPFGMRTEWVYNESGDIFDGNVVYDDGEAAFSMDEEGCVRWNDLKENAGEGLQFSPTTG